VTRKKEIKVNANEEKKNKEREEKEKRITYEDSYKFKSNISNNVSDGIKCPISFFNIS
jgi:hypothetical protein